MNRWTHVDEQTVTWTDGQADTLTDEQTDTWTHKKTKNAWVAVLRYLPIREVVN